MLLVTLPMSFPGYDAVFVEDRWETHVSHLMMHATACGGALGRIAVGDLPADGDTVVLLQMCSRIDAMFEELDYNRRPRGEPPPNDSANHLIGDVLVPVGRPQRSWLCQLRRRLQMAAHHQLGHRAADNLRNQMYQLSQHCRAAISSPPERLI